MNITIEDLAKKRAACVASLDEEKHCGTCKHDGCAISSLPCNECYNEMLFMPVDPTKWESKP